MKKLTEVIHKQDIKYNKLLKELDKRKNNNVI